jgi:hypothetical protein
MCRNAETFVPAFFSIILTDVGELMWQCGKFKILLPPISGITIGCDKVMRKTIILLVFLTYLCDAPAQEWSMAANFDFCGPGREGAGSLEYDARIGGVDTDGNVYVATSSWPGSQGTWRAYNIAKVDHQGNKVWSLLMNDYTFGRIATDLQGNTFIAAYDKLACIDKNGQKAWEVNTAWFRGYGDVFLTDEGFFVNGGEKSGDTMRTFIAKFSTAGQLLSIRYDHKDGILFIDQNGNSYFTTTTVEYDPATGNSAKLWKYNSSGQLLFEKFIPHMPTTIKADPLGNIFIKGEMYPGGTLNINGHTYSIPQNSEMYSHYLIKYDLSGNYLWHKMVTGYLGSSDITVDSAANMYYTVNYSSTLDINGEVKYNNGDHQGDVVTIKLNPEGKILWKIASQAQASWVSSQPDRIKVYNNDVYICGGTETGAVFGSFAINSFDDDLLVARIDQSNVVGIEESVVSNARLLIYPNPSSGHFILQSNETKGEVFAFKVFDTMGRLVNDSEVSTVTHGDIDLSAQPKGIYFLQVTAGDKRFVKKLVKN